MLKKVGLTGLVALKEGLNGECGEPGKSVCGMLDPWRPPPGELMPIAGTSDERGVAEKPRSGLLLTCDNSGERGDMGERGDIGERGERGDSWRLLSSGGGGERR